MPVDDQPIPTPLPQRIADFKQRRLPMIVWGVSALICAWMLANRVGQFEHIGLAQAADYEISSAMTGRLDDVLVSTYDLVEAGQIVATLDDSELEARIERSKATVRQLTAQLAAIREGYGFDQAGLSNDLRRFHTDEEDRRLATMQLRVETEGDEIELERLNLQTARAEQLLSSGVMSQLEFDEIRLQREVVATRLEENRRLLESTARELEAAEARRREFERRLPETPAVDPVLAPLREAIAAESHRVREIQARRDVTVLRSPVAGQVSRVLCRRGQTVVPGEPILTITDAAVEEIVAYLHESDARPIRHSDAVLVSKLSRPGKIVESYVVRVGPGVEQMPQRLWRSPSVPDYGRAVIIAALPGMNLAPGELLTVRFRP